MIRSHWQRAPAMPFTRWLPVSGPSTTFARPRKRAERERTSSRGRNRAARRAFIARRGKRLIPSHPKYRCSSSPSFGANLTKQRWLVLAVMCGIAIAVALPQLTSFSLFPASRTDSLAGVAAGMVPGSIILWIILRSAETDDPSR